jgi:hypothetical protein
MRELCSRMIISEITSRRLFVFGLILHPDFRAEWKHMIANTCSDPDPRFCYGTTLVHRFAETGCLSLLRYSVEVEGMNPMPRNKQGQTTLDIVCEKIRLIKPNDQFESSRRLERIVDYLFRIEQRTKEGLTMISVSLDILPDLVKIIGQYWAFQLLNLH